MQVKEIKRGDAFSAGNKTSNTLSKQKSDAVITVLILSIGCVCLTSPGDIIWMVRNSLGTFLPKDVTNFLGGIMRLNDMRKFISFISYIFDNFSLQVCLIFSFSGELQLFLFVRVMGLNTTKISIKFLKNLTKFKKCS